MKLQRVYRQIENFSLSLKWLRGDEYLSLFVGNGQEYSKDPTIEQVSFGYSYVTDVKMHPYEGRRQDCYAAIDIYLDDKLAFGIPILPMAYLKEMLTSETYHNPCYFKGGYKEYEKCANTGRFRVSVNYHNNKMCKYYADIFFEFRGQPIEDGRILCLRKTDVPHLVKVFNICESELYKSLPSLQAKMNKQ